MAPNLSINSSKPLASTNVPHIPAFALTGSNLAVNGHTILHDVPPNIILTPSTTVCNGKPLPDPTGAFLGFDSPTAASRHIVPLGRLFDIRFSSIFRFKVWWTTHWTGSTGSDLEHETQFLLLDRSASGRPHVLLLPIIDGPFRASLQPGANCNVDLCLESGSSVVCGSHFTSCIYMHAGDDPYALVRDAMRVVRAYMGGTFKLLEEKSPPGVVDKFGWCTWDAFYLKVGPEGVMEGVRRLADGGCPPGHVLIDDGWQSVCHDRSNPLTCEDPLSSTSAGDQMPCRLVKFEENNKFRGYESRRPGGRKGMGAFISDLKREFETVEYVYTWHALCGYWGGVRPDVEGMPAARVLTPRLSEGLKKTMEDLAVDKIVGNGVGLVAPERVGELYEGLHSQLESAGIDGVKVDVIHLLEMLCEDYGGRVELAKAYYKALTASVQKHFKGNGVIASMEHCNDFFLLGTEAIALGRVGDDFWCTDPSGDPNGTFWLQGCHMVHCAYNSLWMGNFIQPDWDMFQSTHPCATFHAASRAISGGPIYISDAVGKHDFGLLKSLALPDGTILRCEHYALPTRDCLFDDPLHDGKTMLKICNLNKFTGVIGAFNCQGGGWSRQDRRNKCAAECSRPVTATVGPADVEWCNGRTPISVHGVELFAVYLFQARQLVLLNPEEFISITLDPFNYELFTVAPVKVSLSIPVVRFAPIGLVNMLNTGGAIQSVEYKDEEGFTVEIRVKGTGELKVFSSMMPVVCRVNGQAVGFMYEKKVVDVEVPWSGSSSKLTVVEYIF